MIVRDVAMPNSAPGRSLIANVTDDSANCWVFVNPTADSRVIAAATIGCSCSIVSDGGGDAAEVLMNFSPPAACSVLATVVLATVVLATVVLAENSDVLPLASVAVATI